MTHRTIEGLIWARQAEYEARICLSSVRGQKQLGIRYEKALREVNSRRPARVLVRIPGQNGFAGCQPDFCPSDHWGELVCYPRMCYYLDGRGPFAA